MTPHRPDGPDGDGTSDGEGLVALRDVESFEEHIDPPGTRESIPHLASVYERTDEQFNDAIPFLLQGLERGERCIYVLDDSDEATFHERLREAGVDVDAALAEDRLRVLTREAYVRGESFSPAEQVARLEDAVAAASEEGDRLRIAVEMTWFLGVDRGFEGLVEFEQLANRAFHGTGAMALCQFNRSRFPDDVVDDALRSHPHVLHSQSVGENPSFVPTADLGGGASPTDRPAGSREGGAVVGPAPVVRERRLRTVIDVIADPDRDFEGTLQALFELGCAWFGFELGAMARVDARTDRFEVEYTSDAHDHYEPGLELPLSETFSTAAMGDDATAGVSDPVEEGYEEITVYRSFGMRAYLGTHIGIDGDDDRTFFFVSSDSEKDPVPPAQHSSLRLMGQWVKSALERRKRETRLAARNVHLERTNQIHALV